MPDNERNAFMAWIEVEPAYGRDYTTAKAAKQDWKDGKDFRETSSGSYVTKEEAKRQGLSVTIRYAKSLKVTSA
jgi:hypothetical protein